MENDPRRLAFQVLLSWQTSKHTLDYALEIHADTFSALSKKDKRLCNTLIFGVLRHRESLDWIIQAFSDIAINKIKLKPLYLIRLALFQIIHLDRIPAFAAINSSVEIGKKECGRKTAGFINAVLRKAGKKHSIVKPPEISKDPAGFISVSCSLPLWLAEKWVQAFGVDQALHLCRQINTIPMITLRTNTLKTDRTTLETHLSKSVKTIAPTKYAEYGLRFSHPDIPIFDLEPFKNGWFQIQDEAAQLVTEFMAPRPGETVLDACSGLGGKTGHIAQMMENKGTLTAIDVESYKLDALAHDTQRLGISIIQTRAMNLMKTSIKDFKTYFDRVLVDAPCTGLGVMQRNPDTKWKRSAHDITRMAGRQKKILNAAANLVKPGGILVYAVCSCESEENEDVVHAFLNKRKDFSIDKDVNFDKFKVFITAEGFLKTYPHTADMDGFFAARFKRKTKS